MNVALLGNAIRRKRIQLGLTQQQLADMAVLSRQTLNGIEHGHVNVTVDTLGRLLDVLGLTLEVADPEQKRGRPARAVWMAAKGANTSYSGEL
ncbi:helix-turn-helix domain-containing protein, partial [Salmonella enterica]|nr:helix-turn-helix domain-containing protein [Salmonella enterica]